MDANINVKAFLISIKAWNDLIPFIKGYVFLV
jgi:hypothetical protein